MPRQCILGGSGGRHSDRGIPCSAFRAGWVKEHATGETSGPLRERAAADKTGSYGAHSGRRRLGQLTKRKSSPWQDAKPQENAKHKMHRCGAS